MYSGKSNRIVTRDAPLVPHELVNHVADAATCIQDGCLEYYGCGVCGKNFADKNGAVELDSTTDPKLGHSLVHHPAAKKTGAADGKTEYGECLCCHEYIEDAADGFDYGGSCCACVYRGDCRGDYQQS